MATKSKSKNSSDKQKRQSLIQMIRMVDLRRTFIIFAIIYFPVVWLFTGRGLLEEVILAVYGISLLIVGSVLVLSFVGRLVYDANSHSGMYGGLFASYIVNAFFPLAVFKFVVFALMRVLPATHSDKIVCDLVCLSRSLYFQIYQVQRVLDLVIMGSLVIMFVFTLWSVGRKN